MSIQVKVLNGITLATAIGMSLASLTVAAPLRAQTVSTDSLYEIADDTVAELLADNNCAILTKQGFIIIPDGVDPDTDGDGRAERFCTPGFVQRIIMNETFSETDLLIPTDLDKDGTLERDETHILEISNIRSVREITPGKYYIVISGTGTVNEANVIDLVEVSEDEARALLEEIERDRIIRVSAPPARPAPAPTPAPAPRVQPPPPPAPAPRVQPPAQPVPGLW